MKGFKKVFYIFIATLMLFTLNVTAFAGNETNDGNIKIQVATDKGSYGATGVAEITATITNVSGEDINNVTAQAVFDDLAPAGKRKSETSKSVDVLKSGESFSFTYKATLNKDEHKLNIFQKIVLWFVRLFNGGYNANNNNIDVVSECVTEIEFGKFTAENIVQVGYEEIKDEISDNDFKIFQDIRESIENLSNVQQVIKVLDDEIKKGNVKKYQINENYITFETESGIRGIWEDETLFNSENKSVSLDGKSNKVKKTPSGNSYKDIIKQVSSMSVISSLGDIAVIRPYRSTDFKYDDFITTGEIIADTIGVDIDIFDNANASLSVLKNLDKYGVVLIDSHGSLINDEPYICLTQTYNIEEVSSSDLEYIWINQNNLIRVHSSFFENNYIDNEFDECLVFLGTCYSMHDNSFSDTLIEKGVDCVYGYTDTVSVSYCNDTLVESMLENILMDGDTSDLAYRETISVCGVTDPHNSDTNFVMQQSDDFCLSKTGYIVGIVKDKYTDKKLSNITITAKSDKYIGATNTETDGTFKLRLPVGKYTISAIGSGGYREEQGFIITVEKDSAKTLPNPIYMINRNTGAVSGTVLEESTGTPINAVTVTATKDRLTKTTTTDESGVFRLELPVGDWQITLSSDTHTYDEYAAVKIEKDVDRVLQYPIYMTPKKGRVVFYSVKDSVTSEIINGVTIDIINTKTNKVVATRTTSDIGSPFCVLPYGTYDIVFQHDAYETYRETIVIGYGEIPIKNIKLQPKVGNSTGTVMGTVTDNTYMYSPPIYGVKVSAIDNNGKVTATTTTDENGRYTLKLPYGSYSILFECNNYESYEMQLTVSSNSYTRNIELQQKLDDRNTIASGDCGANGDNITWTLYEDGELVISGSGAMEDYESCYNTPWRSYHESILKVTIKKGITKIGDNSFEECTDITEVNFSETIDVLGCSAFFNCYNLKKVNITDLAKWCEIEFSDEFSNPLMEANNLYLNNVLVENLLIPYGTTKISSYAFRNCESIKSVTIPETATKIGKYAFYECKNAEMVIIPSTLIEVGGSAFNGCNNLKKIYISNLAKWCEIKFIDIWSNPLVSGGNLYLNEKLLEELTIPENVTQIGDYAFIGCDSIKNVTIPNSVTSIGKYTFYSCDKMSQIELPNNIDAIEVCTFYSCDSLTNVVIPNSVTAIKESAFNGCDKLNSITLPKTLEKIENNAFRDCSKLKYVYYKGSKEIWNRINIGDFNQYITSAQIYYNS